MHGVLTMLLLVIYTAMVFVGEGLAIFAGFWLDRAVPDYSMVIFVTLLFGILVGAWPIAVVSAERLFPGRD